MRKFILSRYILREHLGPFCFSFAIMALLFVLDLVFRHLSRMLSKGLPVDVVLEFFGLNLAWIVATVAPMAVLTATLMAYGRLAADHEIIAMQASGISLLRQALPVFIAAAVLAFGLIWFNNNVLPDFNFRARVLAMDIARKKPGVKIEPGVWCHEIPHYGLLAEALVDSDEVTKAYELVIDENNQTDLRRTTSARSGLIQPSPEDGALLFTLFNGEIQEINLQKLEEFRRLTFAKHTLSIKVDEEMFFRRSDSGMRTDREKSVDEMWHEVRENRAAAAMLAQRLNLLAGGDLQRHLGNNCGLVPDSLVSKLAAPLPSRHSLSEQKWLLSEIEALCASMRHSQRLAQMLLVEIHKKYAISAACMVFVLIGAPLGVLARRGGLATGVGLSLGFFLLYWACLIGGEDLADREIVSPLVAMWSANFLIGGAGIYVFRRIGSGRLAPVSPRLTNLLHQISWRGYRGKSRRHVEDLPLSTPPRRQETVAAKSVLPATVTANSQPLVVESPVPKPRPVAPPVPVSLPQLELTPVPEILRHFTNRTRADLVFLIDCRGVPLAYCKNPTATLPPGADLAMLAKLAASQIATTQALGRSLGEDDHFFSSFQEGERRNVLNLQINRDFILLALFDKTAMLGAIRLHAHEARTNLQKILE